MCNAKICPSKFVHLDKCLCFRTFNSRLNKGLRHSFVLDYYNYSLGDFSELVETWENWVLMCNVAEACAILQLITLWSHRMESIEWEAVFLETYIVSMLFLKNFRQNANRTLITFFQKCLWNSTMQGILDKRTNYCVLLHFLFWVTWLWAWPNDIIDWITLTLNE